jgi:hypothetical protein
MRAQARVECVLREEARTLAVKAHLEGGHWGRDVIKTVLLDHIWSPKLNASILEAIRACAKCKILIQHIYTHYSNQSLGDIHLNF